ncbi:MAG: type I restriction enzyme S subunit, partial [Phenylobacterium sp.]
MKKLFNPISKPQPLPTPLMELAQFTQSITTGYSGKSSATTTGPKLLRPMNIQGNKINWDNVNHCDIIDTDKTKYQLRKGDILIISGGPTAGRSLILDQDINDCIYASSLLRIRCNTNTTAEYLAYYFRSKAYWAQLENLLFSGTVQRRVNTSQFKRLPLPVASLDEQKVITTQLNTLLTQAESTKAGLEETTATLKSFRQSVLNAAVNGKLTEQWRQHNRYHPISIDVGIPAMADSWQIVKLEQLLNPNKPICYGAVGS